MRVSAKTFANVCFLAGCGLLALSFFLAYHEPSSSAMPRTSTRRNVLMVIADDLRPQLGIYHQHGMGGDVSSHMSTPCLDTLAARSLLLTNALVQYSVCGPSRASALTSRRPSTTKVYSLSQYWRLTGGNFTTLPQYFKQEGYATKGIGKIFHHGRASGRNNDAISWTHKFYQPTDSFWNSKAHSWEAVDAATRTKHPLPDDLVLREAIQSLKELSQDYRETNTNFFLAVGFYRPHLPWIFPEDFLSLYPMEQMDLASNPYPPLDVPPIAMTDYVEMLVYDDLKALNTTGNYWEELPKATSLELRRAYYASTSYIDFLVGQLLDAFAEESLADDTVVAFWGDHGFLLGEHSSWAKHSLFELATHIPMMLHIPGLTDNGVVSSQVVELIDLFPTLADAAGLPLVPQCPPESRNISLCTQGRSFMPLVYDPESSQWEGRAFSEQARMNDGQIVIGHSIRTQRYRYTEWPRWPQKKVDWGDLRGIELYDLERDPSENINLGSRPGYASVRRRLSQQLHKALESYGVQSV